MIISSQIFLSCMIGQMMPQQLVTTLRVNQIVLVGRLTRDIAVNKSNNGTKVATFNHLAPCDWAVSSPKVAATLQMLPDWKAGEIASGKSTFYNAGTLGNGTLAVYVDPNRTGAQEDELTLGYKSKDSTYGAGVVYSPYTNWMSPQVVNPENFDEVRGFFNRYALTMAPRGCYNYARVLVNNLM